MCTSVPDFRMAAPHLPNYQPAKMRKLKDHLKEKTKRLGQGKPPAPTSRVDDHVDDGAGHSAMAMEASGSEGRSPAPSPGSGETPAQQDFWQRAFAMLSEEEKENLSVLANRGQPSTQPADDMSSVVPSLIAVTRRRQEECEKRFWRISLRGGSGNEIILRDQAAQIISWLTKAGDIGAMFSPSLVQQIWPCVRAIMQISASEIDQMAAVLQVAEKVTRVTARGSIYEACYTVANTPTDALRMLHEALIALYKATLMLLSKAVGLLDKNMLRRTVHSILHPEEIKKESGSDFADLETRLARDVQAAEAVRSAAIDVDLLRRLQNLEAPVVRVDENLAKVLETIETGEEQNVLDWVSSVTYSGHHDTVVESRMDDTCGWLLSHSKFQEWENSRGSSLMWLQGTTGTGKTCLTSKVIDHKKSILNGAPNNEALAFFYFNRTDSSRNSALSCLKSLIRQLSTPGRQQGHVPNALRELYNECRRGGRTLSLELCRRHLVHHSLNIFSRTTFIVDAVDECGQDDREDLIQIFDELMGTTGSGRPLVIFISGRPDGDIRAALRNRTTVEIGVEDNQVDIARFIKERLRRHRRWDRFDETLKDNVVNTLLEKSQGMFRWTKLQLDQLLTLSLPEDVNSRLGKLPRDLKAAYDEIYLSHDGYESKVIDRAIMWMLASMQPVGSEVLLSVVRIDTSIYVDSVLKPTKPDTELSTDENVKYVSSEVDNDLLLHLCANLLTLDSHAQWQFCHASVSEYFEDNHFNRLQTHTNAAFVSLVLTIDVWGSMKSQQQLGAAKCLWRPYVHPLRRFKNLPWLSEGDTHFRGGPPLKPRRTAYINPPTSSFHYRGGSIMTHHLVLYAADSWVEHVTMVENSLGLDCDESSARNEHMLATTGDLSALLRKFLGHPNRSSAAYRHWLSNVENTIDTGVAGSWHSSASNMYASFTMVRFGIFNLLQSWWQISPAIEEDRSSKEDTNANFLIDTTVLSEEGWSLLALACHFGHLSIVETLLTAGMKANDHNRDTDDPLYGVHPLILASKQGWGEICKLLIERGGYDLNFPADLDHPLYCATERKHLDLLRYLLSAGADPSIPVRFRQQKFDRPGSALVAAAYNNNVETLQIMVKTGNTDPNTLLPGDYHLGSAIIAAAFEHSIDALKYLVLEEHVDVNAEFTTGLFGSVLIAAAATGWQMSMETLRFLGQHGVNFNTRLRERNGSHIYLQIEDPGTVLEKAAIEAILFKSTSVLEILVEECKADVNYLSEDGPYGCALAAAQDRNLQLYRRHFYGKRHNKALQISQWLVKHGANVNLQLPHGIFHSPLVAAAALSDRETMEYLIDEGADANLELQYGDYGSALAFAAAGGYLESAQCLIDRGANVNLPLIHGKYRSALMAAAGAGDEDAVQFLINNGADINQPENINWEDLLLMGMAKLKDRRTLLSSPFWSCTSSDVYG